MKLRNVARIMKRNSNVRLQSWAISTLLLTAVAFPTSTSRAEIIITSNPTIAGAFMVGATVENFDDLTAFAISSYAAGQTIDAGAKFSSRDGTKEPTFHSGGASPNNPAGNPGSPVGVFAPEGAISGDVVSFANVLGPLVIFTDEPFNNGFLEVIFPSEVSRVGFWVTSGAVNLDLRDNTGLSLSGDASASVSAGQFVGITRITADIKIAALIPKQTDHFTIDDFTFSTPVPEPSTLLLGAFASVGLLLLSRHL